MDVQISYLSQLYKYKDIILKFLYETIRTTVDKRAKAKKIKQMKTSQQQHRCGSTLVQTINAPLPLVWSILRRFDYPQAYKQFVKTCDLSSGDGGEGSVRDVTVVSGLPAGYSIERLDELDDESHVMAISIIGGDHRLLNYRSKTTAFVAAEEEEKTVVVESYMVDVPKGNSVEETTSFADTIVGFNLKSLAKLSENMAPKRKS
ncbi:hypothetical protein YC2023_084750 [Brassica napus]